MPAIDSPRPLRICFVAPALYPLLAGRHEIAVVGGAEVQQALIARELVRRGHEVIVASFDYGQPEGEVIDGIRFIRLFKPGAGLRGMRALHPRLTGIWRALRRADADIYYQRSSSMLTGIISLFCRLHGRACLYAGAADVDFTPGSEKIYAPWDRWLFRHGLRNVDRVVVQNAQQQAAYREHYGREATLIRSLFEPGPAVQRAPGERPVEVLWCGMMRDVKRPELLLELARRLPEVRFRMVGGAVKTADGKAAYERVAQAAAGVPNVLLEGFLPYEEADRRFLQARVLVNTSRSEGFPNTFAQAWSRGVPTLSFVDVGARQGGQPVGAVCASLDEMEQVLRRWMTDDEAWDRESARAKAYFEANHSASATIASYESLFQQMLQPSLQEA